MSVTPAAVPLKGGTKITISGLYFLPTIKFKITEFGDITDISEYVSSSQIKIIAPPQETTGEKNIFLSNNIEDFYQRFDFPLLYYNEINVLSVTPNVILIGSNTKVTITGSGFINSDKVINALMINSVLVYTTVVDAQTIT
mmetsp:Transcript_42772/g.50142  ORF Transcript_42772/g.50142 Transcript_42772/m.50142 type:complete len:141 (-) Transcript_42772:1621-2043(-)